MGAYHFDVSGVTVKGRWWWPVFWVFAVAVAVAPSMIVAHSLGLFDFRDSEQIVETNGEVSPSFSPAVGFMQKALGDGALWAADLVGSECLSVEPVLSGTSSDGSLSLMVFPTGFGGVAIESLIECGEQGADFNGRSTAIVDTSLGQRIFWQAGDVVAGFSTELEIAEEAPQLQTDLVESDCLSMNVSVQDATRNPAFDTYIPWTPEERVSIESSGPLITVADTPPVLLDFAVVKKPDGVVGPDLPEPVSKPEPLDFPGVEPISEMVEVPRADVNGPGCGWEFTGTVPPVFDESQIASERSEIIAKAKRGLEESVVRWKVEAAEFLDDLPGFTKKASVWNEYVLQASLVVSAWDRQAAALSVYREDLEAYNLAVKALEQFDKDREQAQKAYDRELQDCLSGSQGGSQSGPQSGGEVSCVVERPPILDQQPPEVPIRPVTPVLWPSGDWL